jgi:hypothetical protein
MNDRKFWVYLDKPAGKIRDLGDMLYLRCDNIEDAKAIAALFEKSGFKAQAGESTSGLGASFKSGEYEC